ncbi:LOW QUALITY PROTEIN: Oxysterol-binding protein-related protein 5 [Galemys pyrenaicus]|uniref:Oxysterol-binding protein-related protein 5 n=1 Tax=Galemys pyrenaicus TaxID=202257 RepID=A0A8J6AUM4_GALPY|nr:LOW QUALITY PROTEIN: Oxysterol-binding protein-related protein 5 [Galemys pyrenaicus]
MTSALSSFQKPPGAHAMKEEAFLRHRFSLCPPSSTPQKADPRRLARHLLFGAENELYPLSPGKDVELVSPSPRDKDPSSPSSATKVPPAEYRLCDGADKDCVSPATKATKKEVLKAQKESYRQEKKRATEQLFSALTDPSVVIMADSLKIRGTLKSWTKLWCVLKPGVLLLYKTPAVGQWVGTVLLHCCRLLQRPSKKDGFCFKLFHPLDQSVWAMKGPKGESVGSITQPLPTSYLIFRAASESDGRCWLDALELALCCSSLLRLSGGRQSRDEEPGSSPDASPSSLCGLPPVATLHADQDLFPLTVSSLENDAFSGKSERENAEEPDAEPQERGRRAESGSDQSEAPGGAARGATTYVEQAHEELGELGEASRVETVSEESKNLLWVLLKQLRPGMDLSRVVLPTFVLEPRSFLDKLSDSYCHADLLSRAALEEDAYSRMKLVLRWYLSGFYKKPKGIKKPYNPILGETFRCCWFHPQTDSRTFYIAEQARPLGGVWRFRGACGDGPCRGGVVGRGLRGGAFRGAPAPTASRFSQVSHHPPVSAFHVSNRKDGFCVSGSVTAKSRFYGNSLSALLDGKATLAFPAWDEEYALTMPYAHCRGILYGTMTMELGGTVTVECQKNGLQAQLEFKLKPSFGGSRSINRISGKITSGEEVLARLSGHWDREVFIREEGRAGSQLFWSPGGEARRQRLKRSTVPLEEQTELESERLWQHVTVAIGEGDQARATQEKCALEEAQQLRSRRRQQSLTPWTPRLFRLDPAAQQWLYRHENRSPWDPRKDVAQFERDGVLHTLTRQATGRPRRQHGAQAQRVGVRLQASPPTPTCPASSSLPTPPAARWPSTHGPQMERDAAEGPWCGSPCPPLLPLQGPGPDRQLRKASGQPPDHSQVTESSSSTPDSCQELSEDGEDGGFLPGSESRSPRRGKEELRLRALREAVLSVREAQQELHRHVSAMLSCTVRARPAPAPWPLRSPRSWFVLCVLLACQLLTNYVLK